jgi:putative transposase
MEVHHWKVQGRTQRGPREKDRHRRRSLRLRNFDYRNPGPYHIILGTLHKRRLLADSQLAERLITLLEEEAIAAGALVYAYCLMPDHVHILLSPGPDQNIIRLIQRFKSRATRIHRQLGKEGPLWQRGFYDHILRREEGIKEVARYILANPVRKGLAPSVVDYPFSGSFVFDKTQM